MNKKIEAVIELLKESNLDGCITGSCMLSNDDFNTWRSKPDVDLFVFSRVALAEAVAYAQYKLGFEFGTDGSEQSRLQQETLYSWARQFKKSDGLGVHTVKLHKDDVVLNITFKDKCYTTLDVLSTFDMSIIMRGYDIKKKFLLDFTGMWSDPNVAVPNPLRDQEPTRNKVRYWIRQFDRVIKYSERGKDTRKMAEFYLVQMIRALKQGPIWNSEASMNAYEESKEEFDLMYATIYEWLVSKLDDGERKALDKKLSEEKGDLEW